MFKNRIFRLIQIILVSFLTIHSQPINFIKLDNTNVFNSEYNDFPWPRWKIALSFANPILTEDDFDIQQKLFKEISPNQSFYNFICNEITSTLISKSQFMAVEWHPIPLKSKNVSYVHQNEIYSLTLPDSATETYGNTGCRFTLLLQNFHSVSRPAEKVKSLMPNVTVTDHGRTNENPVVFSFTYVIYDLLENKIVQFGKAFDDKNKKVTTKDNIKQCLNNALIDVLEVSKFYYKK